MNGTLLLTHSCRPVDFRRASLNFLTDRYADPERLRSLPLFEALAPESDYLGHCGAFTLHRVELLEDGRLTSRLCASLSHERKIQHVAKAGCDSLAVCFEDHLELWRFERPINELRGRLEGRYLVESRIDHPWFAGLHNVLCLPRWLVVSASAPDALLVIDRNSAKVSRVLRMPTELYGSNYALQPGTHDLHRHYIANDHQTTHVNWVSAAGEGCLLVCALIPGCIGRFDLETGDYSELVRGFVGCHGARLSSCGDIYFADTVNGNLVFIDWDGTLQRRYAVESRWLHDVQELTPHHYALAMADSNRFAILDTRAGQTTLGHQFRNCRSDRWQHLFARYFGWLGNSTQFFSFQPDPTED